jgi:hypothetical protein
MENPLEVRLGAGRKASNPIAIASANDISVRGRKVMVKQDVADTTDNRVSTCHPGRDGHGILYVRCLPSSPFARPPPSLSC